MALSLEHRNGTPSQNGAELAMVILKQGPDAEVIAPTTLRE